jgi:catechol 2,3-dioxygenase-like lactoylglutathione lyase family enzyme
MKIDRIDHIVLAVRSIERTCAFYSSAFGMEVLSFGEGRKTLAFGRQKLNLHGLGKEFEHRVGRPTPGLIDLCLITDTPLVEEHQHLADTGVTVLEGAIQRTDATGLILSIYVRDPDDNLIEVSNYL